MPVNVILICYFNLTGVTGIGIMAMGDALTLFWVDYQFTTNITYCVDVIKTLKSIEVSSLVSSVCGLTETVFIFSPPDHAPCDTFNFTVTPTNEVDNGTSSDLITWYPPLTRGEIN